MSSRSACPSEHELLDVATGRMVLSLEPALQAHIGRCSACRSALVALVRSEPADGRASRPGDVVRDRYALVRSIGSGASGVVWEARDRYEGDRSIALKIMRASPQGQHDRLSRRQRLEVRVTSFLRHPNIVPVLDVIEANDARGVVLVMPLLRGGTLEDAFRRDKLLSLPQTAAIFVPALDAVAFAHERGVVHRDLKPQNIFLSDEGVRILDFGVAKVLADASIERGSLETRTGELLGTPRYMAPEQIFGERDVDQRVDVWAMAALVYRAFAGEAPVVATTLGEMMKALARGRIVPLEERAPHVPRPITEAVGRALATDRTTRTASVLPLRDALRDAAPTKIG